MSGLDHLGRFGIMKAISDLPLKADI